MFIPFILKIFIKNSHVLSPGLDPGNRRDEHLDGKLRVSYNKM